jgi:hypothetical protein
MKLSSIKLRYLLGLITRQQAVEEVLEKANLVVVLVGGASVAGALCSFLAFATKAGSRAAIIVFFIPHVAIAAQLGLSYLFARLRGERW